MPSKNIKAHSDFIDLLEIRRQQMQQADRKFYSTPAITKIFADELKRLNRSGRHF